MMIKLLLHLLLVHKIKHIFDSSDWTKTKFSSVNSQQNAPALSSRRHFQCVVVTQISLQLINSFAFHFLFSELGMQIWSATG